MEFLSNLQYKFETDIVKNYGFVKDVDIIQDSKIKHHKNRVNHTCCEMLNCENSMLVFFKSLMANVIAAWACSISLASNKTNKIY